LWLISAGADHFRTRYVLPQIVADLSSKGLFTLASVLEAKIHQPGGTLNRL
jgi:hypothetical protein